MVPPFGEGLIGVAGCQAAPDTSRLWRSAFLWIGIGSGIASERREGMGKRRGTGCHAACGVRHKARALFHGFTTSSPGENPLDCMRRAVIDRGAGIARVGGNIASEERRVRVRLDSARRK